MKHFESVKTLMGIMVNLGEFSEIKKNQSLFLLCTLEEIYYNLGILCITKIDIFFIFEKFDQNPYGSRNPVFLKNTKSCVESTGML